MTRRTLLALLGGGAALAVAGAAARLATGYAVHPGDAPLGLDAKGFAIVNALVEAMFPRDGDLPAGLDLGVSQAVDEEVWAMAPEAREAFARALAALELAPLLLGWGGRLSRLPPADRVAALAAIAADGPRALARAAISVKQLLHLVYYADPATWPAVAYDGPWNGLSPRPPASAEAYAALLAARGTP